MIKKITLLMMLLPIFGFGQTTDLLFSEYGEGNSNNKYYEIYNGTGATVNLSDYSVILYSNGGSSAQSTLVLTGTLANNTAYVVANSAAEASLLALADISHATSGFNGDDVLHLIKSGVIIDVFGEVGVDPGASWTIAGNATAGVDKVLTRKATVCSPTDDWAVSFGTDPTDSQWEINALAFNAANMSTVIVGIGSHTANCVGSPCPTLVAPTATDVTICSGSTTTLTATSTETGSILKWYDVATGGSSLFTGSAFTTPVLTANTSYWVKDSIAGCTAGPRTEVIVTVSGIAPTVDAGADQTICAGTEISLTATGTGTFSWDNGVNQAVPFTPTTTTTYTVTVDDGVCTNTDQVTVTVDEPSVAGTISASSLNVCLNDVLTGAITGNTGDVEWLAQAPGIPMFISVATGSTISVPASAAGTYTVKAEVTNGVCPVVTTNILTIVVNALPVVSVSANELTLTASLASVDYQWINCANDSDVAGAIAQTYTATANGSYKVEVTDANGCVATSACETISTVGVETILASNSFSISPNPTKGKVTITAAGTDSGSVVIFNALGKEISRASNIQNGSVIDFTTYNNGVYMVQITTNKGTKVQRVVKN